MEKVKLPLEVAEAIKEFRRCEETTADIITAIFNGANSTAAFNLRKFSKDDGRFEDLLKALVIGYEVEQTPEDEVRKKFKDFMRYAENPDAPNEEQLMFRKLAEGMRHACDILNIKIDGVNA